MLSNLSAMDMIMGGLFLVGMIGLFFYLKNHTNTMQQMQSDLTRATAGIPSHLAMSIRMSELEDSVRKMASSFVLPEPIRPAPPMPTFVPSAPEPSANAFGASPSYASAQALRDAVAAAKVSAPFFFEVNLMLRNGTSEVLNNGPLWITNYREQVDGTVSR